jgi:hypothetical protein
MVRLKKISVPTDFADFPQYALNRGIVDAMVNICVEDYFDDTAPTA